MKELLRNIFCPFSDENITNNKMDDKKNNFIVRGIKQYKIYIFGFKIIHRKKIIEQEFIDEEYKKDNIGFIKE